MSLVFWVWACSRHCWALGFPLLQLTYNEQYGPKSGEPQGRENCRVAFPWPFGDGVSGRRICISDALLQGLGVESWWIPSAGLLSTHFICAAARYSYSPWVSDIPSARTFPPASPRGISHPQSLEQRAGKDTLIIQAVWLGSWVHWMVCWQQESWREANAKNCFKGNWKVSERSLWKWGKDQGVRGWRLKWHELPCSLLLVF